jgi:hydroxypyruvate isomerase
MLKIDALIDLFFKELPWDQRVARIAECGYRYIETWQGGNAEVLKQIGDAGKTCGVELVSIVLNSPGDPKTAPVAAENLQRFVEQIDRNADNALAAGCRQGIITTGPSVSGRSYSAQKQALVEAVRAAGECVGKKGFRLNLEPLNTEVDHPGYFLSSREDSVAIVKEVALDNVRLLYDIYHMDIMFGNQTAFIEANIGSIGHFHSAGIPGRHELFDGETNYPFLAQRIARTTYDGYFGLEYMPLLESRESLTRTLSLLTV